jgi:putative SOS response-associated peptidase YedK
MPAILRKEDREVWLSGSPEEARSLLQPYDPGLMVAYEVGTRVNSPKNNDPALIDALISSAGAMRDT